MTREKKGDTFTSQQEIYVFFQIAIHKNVDTLWLLDKSLLIFSPKIKTLSYTFIKW